MNLDIIRNILQQYTINMVTINITQQMSNSLHNYLLLNLRRICHIHIETQNYCGAYFTFFQSNIT
jgi:hypothetical protein